MQSTDVSLRGLQEKLFKQLDALADARGETGLDEEVLRTKSICLVAGTIIDAGRVGLEAYDLSIKAGLQTDFAPDVLAATPTHRKLKSGSAGAVTCDS